MVIVELSDVNFRGEMTLSPDRTCEGKLPYDSLLDNEDCVLLIVDPAFSRSGSYPEMSDVKMSGSLSSSPWTSEVAEEWCEMTRSAVS